MVWAIIYISNGFIFKAGFIIFLSELVIKSLKTQLKLV